MNMSQSQYNSGCESGWTHYLDHSYVSGSNGIHDDHVVTIPEIEEEEMVSDASSGPQHCQNSYEDVCSISVDSSASKLGKKSKKKKKKTKDSRGKEEHYHFDDAASSSVFSYYSKNKKMNAISKDEPPMQNVMDYSEGFSATHMKGNSALMQHFGYFNSSSLASQKPGDFQGGSWE